MKKTQLIDSSCDFWLSWVSTEISEGRLTDLVIPEYVRIIGPRAFADCKNLVSVTFHSNLTAIGDEAFANCTALKSIEIPETLKILGNAPFIGCTSLSSVTIPGRFLEDFPIIFKGCTAVSSLVLASGSAVVFDGVGAVEPEIGLDLSGYPRLTTLEISERVTEINPQTLSKFSYLKTLKVSKTHKKYQSASRDKLLVEKATGKILYALSANISGDVLGIGPFAFIGVKSLESVFIPKGVIKIDPCAFNGCTELKSIVVSDDNPVYDSRDGSNAIIETSTSTLVVACAGTVLPKGVTDPQQYMIEFLDKTATTLVIPEGITYIDQETLCGFNTFTSIVIPSTVVEINPRVFNESIALEYIKVSPDNPVYDSREDCNAIIDTETNVMLVASMNTKVPAGVDIDPEGSYEIARRSRGTPRIANRMLRRVRDFAQVKADGLISKTVADEALCALEIDRLGLDPIDRRMLGAIIENYGGGPVGLETLAATIGEESVTLEDVYEPYLMQLGFLTRTPRGRCVTQKAYQHLHLPIPGGAVPETSPMEQLTI